MYVSEKNIKGGSRCRGVVKYSEPAKYPVKIAAASRMNEALSKEINK